MLSFLSKHSTRDPGVCRDEIAIAIGVKGGNIQTILVESEQDVQPPVNIGHIQWLDMRDWKERRAPGEAAWEQWYQAKLAEIVRVVESDESRRFAGEIETLNGHLKPIKSEARICQLLSKGFYGRQWLFEAVEKWRCAPTGTPSPLGGVRLLAIGQRHIVASRAGISANRNPRKPFPSTLRTLGDYIQVKRLEPALLSANLLNTWEFQLPSSGPWNPIE